MIALLDVTVKVSVVVLVALAAVLFSSRQSASVRHWILAAAMACAAAVPLLTLVVPSWGALGWAPSLVIPSADQVTVPVVGGSVPVVDADVTAIPSVHTVNAAVPLAASPVVEPVVWLWAGGLVAGLGLLSIGFIRLRRIESRATQVQTETWTANATAIAREYGLRRAPLLLRSDRPALLVTWGWRQPTILVPATAEGWSDDRVRVVLRHELAHIRRCDWMFQLGAEIVRCVYWFNPVVWIACRRMRQESEQACDDAVMKTGVPAHEYATHLLEIARGFHGRRRMWPPAPAIARPSSLERRVRAMLNGGVNREPVTRSMAAAVAGVLLTITISVAGLNGFAQARFATLSGTAKDETGAVMTNATFTLANVETQAKYEVRSNGSGIFEFVGLPAGDYAFEARALGFQPVKDTVSLGVGESLNKDVALKVSTLQENITVTAAGSGRPDTRSARRVESVRPPRRRPCPNPAVGGCIDPPVKLTDVRPVYPASLVGSGIEGTVVIEGLLGTDGRMKDMRVASSPHPAFERAALDAVGAWEFTPTLLNGRTIDVSINVKVNFTEASAEPAPPRP